MTLVVLPVTLPRSLVGVRNGELPASMLEPVGPSGVLHPAAARCWRALVAAGRAEGWELTYTFGGCYRSYPQQEALFRSRYTTEVLAGRPWKMWDGVRWYQRPLTAMAAVPGTSNHGLGLAVDAALGTHPSTAKPITPALPWFREAALEFGFSFEAQSEPWHIRLVCGDNPPAPVLAFEASLRPVPPVPPPTSTEDDPMFYLTSPTPGVRPDLIWFAGRVFGISSPADAEQFLSAGAKRLNLSAAQFDAIVAAG